MRSGDTVVDAHYGDPDVRVSERGTFDEVGQIAFYQPDDELAHPYREEETNGEAEPEKSLSP